MRGGAAGEARKAETLKLSSAAGERSGRDPFLETRREWYPGREIDEMQASRCASCSRVPFRSGQRGHPRGGAAITSCLLAKNKKMSLVPSGQQRGKHRRARTFQRP